MCACPVSVCVSRGRHRFRSSRVGLKRPPSPSRMQRCSLRSHAPRPTVIPLLAGLPSRSARPRAKAGASCRD